MISLLRFASWAVGIFGILGLLGWGAWQLTPGKRSQHLVEHAREMIAEKSWGESVVALRKALDIYPDDKGIRYMLMSSLLAEGKLDEGIAELERIVLMPPFGDDANRQRFSEYYSLVRSGMKSARLRAMAARIRKTMPEQEHWMAAMLDARAAYLSGHYQQSADMFAAIIKKGQRNYQLRLDWGHSLLAAGHAADAGALFEQMVKQDPNAVDALNGEAAALTLQGKADDALDVYIHASLVGQPPALKPLLNGGMFAMNMGRLPEAKKYFIDRISKYWPKDRAGKLLRMRFAVLSDDKPAFTALLGGLHPSLDKREFMPLVQWCTAHTHPVWSLELLDEHAPKGISGDDLAVQRIMAMLALHRMDEATKLASGIKDKDRQSLVLAQLDMARGRTEEAKQRLGAIVAAGKGKPGSVVTQAEQGLDRVRAMQKSLDGVALLPRLRILLGQGYGDEVLKLLDGVKKPTLDLDMMRVMALLQLGHGQQAMARLDGLLKAHPEREDIWLLWGRAVARSDPSRALSGLLSARDKADGPGLESLIGELQYKLGKHDAAIASWQAVADQWPGTLAANVSNVLRAQAYMVSGDWKRAVDVWQQVLKIAPGDPLTLNDLAYSLLKAGGDLQQAEALAVRAQRILPDNAAIADTLTQIRKARQQRGKAPAGA